MAPALVAHSARCNVPLATRCYIHHIFAFIATELDLRISLGPNPGINKDQGSVSDSEWNKYCC